MEMVNVHILLQGIDTTWRVLVDVASSPFYAIPRLAVIFVPTTHQGESNFLSSRFRPDHTQSIGEMSVLALSAELVR